jgi:hypothetical protein
MPEKELSAIPSLLTGGMVGGHLKRDLINISDERRSPLIFISLSPQSPTLSTG